MRTPLLFLCLCVSGWAQVDEELTVYFRDLRVHAVDKQGQPITGLSPEDFIVKEGKRLIKPNFFEEVDLRGPVPNYDSFSEKHHQRAKEPAVLAVYFDSSAMTTKEFDRIREALADLLQRETEEGTKIKLVHMDRSLKHLSPFTNNADTLLAGLSRVQYEGSFRQRIRFQQNRIDDLTGQGNSLLSSVSRLQQDLVQDAVDEKELSKLQHFMTYFHNVGAIAQMMRPLQGPKSILHISGGLFLQNHAGQYISTLPLARELSYQLNQANITMYSFLHTNHAGLAANGASRRNDFNASFGDPFGNSPIENDQQIQTGAKLMADRTGGYFKRVFSTKQILEELRDYWGRSKHYYRIGYTVEASQFARKVRIGLADKAPGKLFFGKQFNQPKPFKKWSKEKRQMQFEASLLHDPGLRDDLQADFTFYQFSSSRGQQLLPVVLSLPKQPQPKKGFDVGFLAYGRDDYLLDMVQATILDPPKDQDLRLYQVLLVNREVTRVRFLVRNNDTGAYTLGEQPIQINQPSNAGVNISQLILNQDDDYTLLPLNHSGKTGKKRAKKQANLPNPRRNLDPLLMNGYVVAAGTHTDFREKEKLDLFFHINGLTESAKNYRIECQLERDGVVVPVTFNILDLVETEQGAYRVYGKLATHQMPPGNYQLRVSVRHPNGNQHTDRAMPFTLNQS